MRYSFIERPSLVLSGAEEAYVWVCLRVDYYRWWQTRTVATRHSAECEVGPGNPEYLSVNKGRYGTKIRMSFGQPGTGGWGITGAHRMGRWVCVPLYVRKYRWRPTRNIVSSGREPVWIASFRQYIQTQPGLVISNIYPAGNRWLYLAFFSTFFLVLRWLGAFWSLEHSFVLVPWKGL